jgi:serine/threonine protein phosphatase PrpC
MLVWHAAAFTHRGRVRSANEDAVAIDLRILTGDMTEPLTVTLATDVCVLMLADGMGGHVHGALASRTILHQLVADTDRLAEATTCAEAIQDANRYLYDLMRSQPDAGGMGSTLVGTVLSPERLLSFNIGDSRAYLLTRGHLVPLSQDDVPDVTTDRSGRRTSHAITQALGGSRFPLPIAPHVNIDPPLGLQETLLLCSDGLTDMVTDNVVRDILSKAANPAAGVRYLAAQAFQAGGRDNISLIVARLAETSKRTG